jgi:hypothetical protein
MPEVATGSGKTDFVKKYLAANPQSNPTAVAEAWIKSGNSGTVSASLVNKLRSQMGLTGNLGTGRKPGKRRKGRLGRKPAALVAVASTGEAEVMPKRRGRPPGSKNRPRLGTAATTTAPARPALSRVSEIDADLDRLIFRVMSLGKLTTVEDKLREARRELYRQLGS